MLNLPAVYPIIVLSGVVGTDENEVLAVEDLVARRRSCRRYGCGCWTLPLLESDLEPSVLDAGVGMEVNNDLFRLEGEDSYG